MGVIYKLKQEVIDFIVSQKTANPDISCRTLSKLVQEKFQVEVSKSSVNTVIKQASLSSPVGRRVGFLSQAKGFKIPKERKEELLLNLKETQPLVEYKDEKALPQIVSDTPSPLHIEKEPMTLEPSTKEETIHPQEKNEAFKIPPEVIALPSELSSSVSSIDKETKDIESPAKPEATPQDISRELSKAYMDHLLKNSKEEKSPTPPTKEENGSPHADVNESVDKITISEDVTKPIEPKLTKFEEKPQEESPSLHIFASEPIDVSKDISSPPESDAISQEDQKEETPPNEDLEEERPRLQEELLRDMVEPPTPEETKEIPVSSIPENLPEEVLPLKEESPSPISDEKEVLPFKEESTAPTSGGEEAPHLEEAPPAPPMDEKEISIPSQVPVDETLIKETTTSIPEPVSEKKDEIQQPSDDIDNKPETLALEKEEQKLEEPMVAPASPQKPIDDKIWTPSPEEILQKEEKEALPAKDRGPLYDGMGCIFLKAAEWELSNSSILGSLLGRYAKNFIATDVNASSEILLYLSAFGIKNALDIEGYKGKGLWELNGIKQDINGNILSQLEKGIQNPKNLSIAMTNEYSQLFSEVSYIKIEFSDRSDICFDAQMKSIWPENSVQPIFPLPINKALSYLSKHVISNVQPIIVQSVPGHKNFAKPFYDMILSCENSPEKKAIKIAIYDSHKEEIAKFTTIPVKRRTFIIGAWPWQEECKRFIEEDARIVKQFYHQALQRDIYYSELSAKLDQQAVGQTVQLRVGLIRDTGLGWPVMAVVTNILDENTPMEEIISDYLKRWPNFQEGYNDFTAKTEKASFGVITLVPWHDRIAMLDGQGTYDLLGGKADVGSNIHFLLSAINNYCQRHFFPPHYEKLNFLSLKERFYGISGYLQRTDDSVYIHLAPFENYGFRKDLEYVIHRLNESDVKDYHGRQLILSII